MPNYIKLILCVLLGIVLGFVLGFYYKGYIPVTYESEQDELLDEIQEKANPFSDMEETEEANPFRDTYQNPFAE